LELGRIGKILERIGNASEQKFLAQLQAPLDIIRHRHRHFFIDGDECANKLIRVPNPIEARLRRLARGVILRATTRLRSSSAESRPMSEAPEFIVSPVQLQTHDISARNRGSRRIFARAEA
jgi:hypothetical protein